MNNIKHLFLPIINAMHWCLYLFVCIVFLTVSTSKFWLYIGIFPFIVIIPMYCGHVYNQPFHNNATIVLIGILYDASFAKPIGLTPAILLILDLLLILSSKKIGAFKFIGQWLFFFLYALLYLVLSTVLQIALSHESISSYHMLQSLLLTWLAFPLFAAAFYYLTYKLKKNSIA
jgi:hypothetical protein